LGFGKKKERERAKGLRTRRTEGDL